MNKKELKQFIEYTFKPSDKPREIIAGIKFLQALSKKQLKYLANSGKLITTTEGLEYIEKELKDE